MCIRDRVRAWTGYRACFDHKEAVEKRRRTESGELVRAVVEFTGARPDLPEQRPSPESRGEHEDRAAERAYAARALAVLDARTAVTAAQDVLTRARITHEHAMTALDRLVLGGAPEADVRAQAGEVREAAAALRAAREDTADLERVLQRELHGVMGRHD